MIGTVYIEQAVAEHARTRAVLERLPSATRVPIERYGEVFNPRGQNFRLQKQRPALILARKPDGFVLPTPESYGIGGEHNHYFSHLLNCPYDCRYCFLQGMYRSANYVLFVNYEDFFDAVAERAAANLASTGGESYFFSGYDGDSLAFDGLTSFVDAALPKFRQLSGAWLELRTKSTQIAPLVANEPLSRCVVAFSFTPEEVWQAMEHGVPSIERRLKAMLRLAELGWPLGLRFDPLIYSDDFADRYRQLFDRVFDLLPVSSLHSVSLGPFRLPAGFHRQLQSLHADDPALMSAPLARHGGMVSYRHDLERRMVEGCSELLRERIPEDIFFPCQLPETEDDQRIAS